jgi:hypothetical protein
MQSAKIGLRLKWHASLLRILIIGKKEFKIFFFQVSNTGIETSLKWVEIKE